VYFIDKQHRIGLEKNCCFFAFSIVSLTSFTPEWTALSLKNGLSSFKAISWARVVFPVPGGPHKISEGRLPVSIAFLSTAPGPTR
jgi:hypothetical protein